MTSHKNFFLLIAILGFISCKSGDKNKFTISGNIKNLENQHIYLEQLYFDDKAPDVLDTAFIQNGKFILKGIADEEGLFRLRLEKSKNIYVVLNDQPKIELTADASIDGLDGQNINTTANMTLKNMILHYISKTELLNQLSRELDSLKTEGADSLAAITNNKYELQVNDYKAFIKSYVDTCKDPIVTLFALGYSNSLDQKDLKKSIDNLSTRFPNHKGISISLAAYHKLMSKEDKPVVAKKPGVGDMAPDFTMNDTEDKSFSLHELKGQYVLVDFWASWCGPCRAENPNVVQAFNKYKNSNFTVLGVSLDEEKIAWLKAIKKDKLSWKHISDLKGWYSAAVNLYGFDGIPYNVLIDPQGKILATELRGSDLEDFLEKTLGNPSK